MFSMFSGDVGNDGSPIAQAVEAATSPLLLGTDWSKNLEICDLINATNDGEKSAIKMLRKQLRSENPKTVKLALELTDAAIKNCSARLHYAVATKLFLGDVVALTEGKKSGMWEARDEALKLIQEWGLEFKDKQDNLPVFYETYISLKTRGATFPKADKSAPVFTPPPAGLEALYDAEDASSSPPQPQSSPPQMASGQGGGVVSAVVNAHEEDTADMLKLKDDLRALSEKIKLCREMLPESPGIEHDETLAEVIGFLEACQPRMVDLVEAGMQGMLDEEVLGTALQVNDDLHKTLEAERSGTPLPAEPAPAAEVSSQGGGGGGGGGVGDLLDMTGGAGTEEATSAVGADEDEEEELSLGRRKKGKGKGAAAASAAGESGPAQDLFGLISEPPPSVAAPPLAPPPTRFGGRFEETMPHIPPAPPSPADAPAALLGASPPSSTDDVAGTITSSAAAEDPFASAVPTTDSVTTLPAAEATVASESSALPPNDPFAGAPTSLEAAGFSIVSPAPGEVSAQVPTTFDTPAYVAPPAAAVVAEQEQQLQATVVDPEIVMTGVPDSELVGGIQPSEQEDLGVQTPAKDPFADLS